MSYLGKFTLACLVATLGLGMNTASAAITEEGIYITQGTMETPQKVNYLIKRSKETGINTFVVDYERMSPVYRKDIALVKASGIQYVARIVVFPNGGAAKEVHSEDYWNKKYQLMKQAISLGANQIQLDYIRYKPSQPPSPQNVANITRVVEWYKDRLKPQGIPLQVDVFGETSYIPSIHIGQNVKNLAKEIDVLCPMLYPSHYAPHAYHTQRPYQTVLNSLNSLNKQFDGNPPFKVIPFIEVRNFRNLSSPRADQVAYLKAQIKAVNDGKAEGWYAWSAGNKYDLLFDTLGSK